jgi:hypothetical protein
MKLLGTRIVLVVIAAAGAVSCISCDRQAGSSSAVGSSKILKPTPEDTLSFVMETFRRRVEETPIGFVIADSNGRSTMTGTNKVSYEIIRPADGGDKLKAIVTVTSQSRYSIKRSKESEEKPEEQAANKSSLDSAEDEQNGVESFDPSVASKQSADTSLSTGRSEDVVARRPEEETRKYELDYVDGRWTLVTQLNPETESSIQNAFKNALDVQ